MYSVKLFDRTGQTPEYLFSDASVRGWSNRVSAPGRFVFTLPVGGRSATQARLQKYKHVTLERKDGEAEGAWSGYVESHKRTSETEYSVFCVGHLQRFRKRLTGADEAFSTDGGSEEAFDLLADLNTEDDTGITAGTGGVVSVRALQVQGRKDALGTLEDMLLAHGAEMEVSFQRQLNFVPSLGTDKTSSIILRFRRDGRPGNTVTGIEEGEDGAPMANRVIGTTTAGGGLEYQWDDPASQTTYGLLEEERAFPEAQDLATLTAMTTAYGQQRANPIQDFQVEPILAERRTDIATGGLTTEGIRYGDIVPGDLVMCDIITETQAVQVAKRVAEIIVEVDDQRRERVKYTLTQSGIYVTAKSLGFDPYGDLLRRVQEVERLL